MPKFNLRPVKYESRHENTPNSPTDNGFSIDLAGGVKIAIEGTCGGESVWAGFAEVRGIGPSADGARKDLIRSLRKVADELDATTLS